MTYDHCMALAEPHLQKARVVLAPMAVSAMEKLKLSQEAVQRHLKKEQYRQLLKYAEMAWDVVQQTWYRVKEYIATIYASEMVR